MSFRMEEDGYHVDRFHGGVNQDLLCSICHNVPKDARLCQNHDHFFCFAHISQHLQRSETCPECREELTPETLRRPKGFIKNYLDDLIINCDYHGRGCPEQVRLESLQNHVDQCGFAPALCENERCRMEINKRDKEYHEKDFCQFRIVDEVQQRQLDRIIQHEVGKATGEFSAILEQLRASQNKENARARQNEMNAGLEQIRAIQNEMNARLEQIRASQNEMNARLEQMRASQNEMNAKKEQMRASQDEMNAIREQITASQNEQTARLEQLIASQTKINARTRRMNTRLKQMRASRNEKNARLEQPRTSKNRLTALLEQGRASKNEMNARHEQTKATEELKQAKDSMTGVKRKRNEIAAVKKLKNDVDKIEQNQVDTRAMMDRRRYNAPTLLERIVEW